MLPQNQTTTVTGITTQNYWNVSKSGMNQIWQVWQNTVSKFLIISCTTSLILSVPPNTRRQSSVQRQGAQDLATYQGITLLIERYPGVHGQTGQWSGKTMLSSNVLRRAAKEKGTQQATTRIIAVFLDALLLTNPGNQSCKLGWVYWQLRFQYLIGLGTIYNQQGS